MPFVQMKRASSALHVFPNILPAMHWASTSCEVSMADVFHEQTDGLHLCTEVGAI